MANQYFAIPFCGGWSIRAGNRELCALVIVDGWQPQHIEVLIGLLNEESDSKAGRVISKFIADRQPVPAIPAFGTKRVESTRPKRTAPEIHVVAVKKILPEVAQWLGDEYEKGEVISDLLEACREERDGYEIARSLDSFHHWTVDAGLVEILDGFSFAISDAHRKAIEAWMPESRLTPEFSEGQEVTFEGHQAFIAAIDSKHGQYTVRVPALGHVESGVGTHGRIVDWEVLHAQPVKAKSA